MTGSSTTSSVSFRDRRVSVPENCLKRTSMSARVSNSNAKDATVASDANVKKMILFFIISASCAISVVCVKNTRDFCV